MTKEEFRKHCEDQIARCIKLKDYKHLKEHELSLALLNECEQRKQNQENLIKYIEDKIKILGERTEKVKTEKDYNELHIRRGTFMEILERIKSGKYE